MVFLKNITICDIFLETKDLYATVKAKHTKLDFGQFFINNLKWEWLFDV